ncbi:MAG: GIY-YIG nuclease family protein [Lactobacillaceae bacterium]|jgi:putative endonuclease|nr:GIY-YIG nuclease family protein [Lactobacillaceae bacterium]
MDGYYFYVIKTADDKFYAGTSNDYVKRFQAHQARKGAKYTKVLIHHPLKLIFVQYFDSKGEALSFENKFKKLKRLEKEKYIKEHKNLL